MTIDLLSNPELLAKFIEPKGWKLKILTLRRAYTKFQLLFRLPEPLDLNRFQKILLKLLVLVLIAIDWYISFCVTMVTIFHIQWPAVIILLLWMTVPNFLPNLWSAAYQLLYVT